MLRVKRSDVKIGEFSPITHQDYHPAGGTPLRDAVGRFIGYLDGVKRDGVVSIGLLLDESGSMSGQRDAVIESVNKFVHSMSDVTKVDPEAGGSVLCVIVTDGYENSSRELSHEELQKIIADREATDEWTFIFLGAKIDAWAQGQALGLSGGYSGQTVSYSGTSMGTAAVMDSVTTDSASFLSANASYKRQRANSAMRSVSDMGVESLGNTNAVAPDAAPTATGWSQGTYGDVDDAIKQARKRTKRS